MQKEKNEGQRKWIEGEWRKRKWRSRGSGGDGGVEEQEEVEEWKSERVEEWKDETARRK